MTREEKKELALKILSVIAATGFLAAAIIAPGILVAGAIFIRGRRVPKKQLQAATQFALKERWVTVDRTSKEARLVLTQTGRRKIVKITFTHDSIRAPVRWDRKWRIVIFDIPEKYKVAREVFRKTLRTIGLLQLQESVWIHPFPCEQVIDEVVKLYTVRPYVRMLLVQHFDGETEFVQKFNLESRLQ